MRKYDYSETSQILRLLTRESGVVAALAKGSKKEKSSFGGALDLFYLGPAVVLFRPRAGLHLLTAFTVEEAWPALRRDLKRFYLACHLAEILTGMTREEEPLPGVFDLLVEGLTALSSAGDRSIPALGASLELRLLAELGFAPSLTACGSCGRELAGRERRLSVSFGGLICADCRDTEARPLTVGPGVVEALRTLAASRPRTAARLRLSRADQRAIRGFLTAFTEWRLERKLRTARFL
ncbi:MAG: DNA repair protein RecO [Planctomycetota bacterium]